MANDDTYKVGDKLIYTGKECKCTSHLGGSSICPGSIVTLVHVLNNDAHVIVTHDNTAVYWTTSSHLQRLPVVVQPPTITAEQPKALRQLIRE